MKQFLRPTLKMSLLALILMPQIAGAGCLADYKAKRGTTPMQLHYGVMQVASCDAQAAGAEVGQRLQANGWQLLKVISVFDDSTPDKKRKARAGAYYLAY